MRSVASAEEHHPPRDAFEWHQLGTPSRRRQDRMSATRSCHEPPARFGHGSRNAPTAHRRPHRCRCPAVHPGPGRRRPDRRRSARRSATRPWRRSSAERPAADRADLAERAVRIGLLALQDAGVTRQRGRRPARVREAGPPGGDGQREGGAGARADAAHQLRRRRRPSAAHAREVPRRPRRAARHGRGAVRRDRSATAPSAGSAGCSSATSTATRPSSPVLLDPTRLNSPMHQFRQEITAGFKGLEERLVAIEAAAAARGAERARSAAKGGDFEDLLEAMLADLARGAGDLLDRTGDGGRHAAQVEEGRLRPDRRRAGGARAATFGSSSRPRTGRCRCGPSATSCARPARTAARPSRSSCSRRPTRRPASRPFTPRRRRRLLRHRPRGAGAGQPRGGASAWRACSRWHRSSSTRSRSTRRRSATPSTAIREQLDVVRSLKAQLTSISTATKAVWSGLDQMRSNILARVARGGGRDPRRSRDSRVRNALVTARNRAAIGSLAVGALS